MKINVDHFEILRKVKKNPNYIQLQECKRNNKNYIFVLYPFYHVIDFIDVCGITDIGTIFLWRTEKF